MAMRGRERPASLCQNCHCSRVTLLIQCLSPEWGQAAGRSGCVGKVVLGSNPRARPAAGQAQRSLPIPPLKYL